MNRNTAIPGLALIGLGEILIFFRNPQHFFMGDSVLWIARRYHTIGDFLQGFLQTDPTLWYRPIAQRTLPSILYPIVGLQPLAYRIVAFLLFFACTVAVFALVERITQSRVAAWFSTIYFATHITNAFTTYDVAFTPEIVFTLFAIGSAIAYVDYLRNPTRRLQVLSAALFAGSLMSKESAVTLPFALIAIWLLLPDARSTPLQSLAPHFAILAAYLLLAVGVFHIRDVSFHSVWSHPVRVGQPGYEIVLGGNITDSIRLALTWAFNISRGINGQWPPSVPSMATALRVFRIVTCAATVLALFGSRRNFIFIGLAWFFIAAAPTLALLNHFLPYYMFAPIVGFSLAIGTVLDDLRQRISKYSRQLAWVLCGSILAIPVTVNANAAERTEETHFLLGGSARSAFDGMSDVRALYPAIPSRTTLVFFNEERPSLSWDQASGMLLQMAYKDDSLKSEYSVDGMKASKEDFAEGRALAFKLTNGKLIDFTSFVKQQPELLLGHAPDLLLRLELSAKEVRGADGEYGVRVSPLKDMTVNALVAHNGILTDPFPIQLDHHGEGKVRVTGATPAGLFTYVALQLPSEPNWVTVSGTIQVIR